MGVGDFSMMNPLDEFKKFWCFAIYSQSFHQDKFVMNIKPKFSFDKLLKSNVYQVFAVLQVFQMDFCQI